VHATVLGLQILESLMHCKLSFMNLPFFHWEPVNCAYLQYIVGN